MNNLVKSAIAEFLGVFVLTFVGAGSILMETLHPGTVGLVGIALAHGLALSVAVSATMNISGGHINPAITLGLLCIGRVKWDRALVYIFAQCLGGLLAGAILAMYLHNISQATLLSTLGTPTPGAYGSPAVVAVFEGIGTFILAFAVYGTAAGSKAPGGLGGFGVGLTLTMVIFAIGNLTGSALNPARFLGTGFFAGQLDLLWIYIFGPVGGAIAAMLICSKVLEPDAQKA